MNAITLLDELSTITKDNLRQVQSLKKLSLDELNFKPDTESWSVLECIEHLNRYGNFYIPEIRKRIAQYNYKTSPVFKHGWLGNYFVQSMLPKEKLNKMKTFKSMNPNNSKLDSAILDTFILQQEALLDLLNQARNTDLTRVKTAISITRWIKLKLGDTFRVVIYHNLRHIIQARNVLERIPQNQSVVNSANCS